MNVEKLPAFVISLKEEAYKKTKKRLQDAGFKNIEWFPAVKGKDRADELRNNRQMLSYRALVEIDHSQFREAHSSLPSWGGVGCYLSHVEMWKRARDSEQGILIFEEDAVPVNSAFKKVKEVINRMYEVNKKAPDLLQIGGFNIPDTEKVPDVPSVGRAKGRMYGTEAYYLSPEGGAKLMQNAFPMEVQCDSFIGYVLAEQYDDPDGFKAYVIKEKFIKQENEEGTTIQLKPIHDEAPGGPGVNYKMIILIILVLILGLLVYKRKALEQL